MMSNINPSETLRRIIRADGSVELLEVPQTISEIHALINADTLDSVRLHNGMVMALDDIGHLKNLPVNYAATFLYHGVCRPGVQWQILGDVVIVPDSDFGSLDD